MIFHQNLLPLSSGSKKTQDIFLKKCLLQRGHFFLKASDLKGSELPFHLFILDGILIFVS